MQHPWKVTTTKLVMEVAEAQLADLRKELAERADCERSLTEWNEQLTSEVESLQAKLLKIREAMGAYPDSDLASLAETLRKSNEWIPVEERLPANGERVLMVTFYKGTQSQRTGTYANGNFYVLGLLRTNKVTHWRPLPPLPGVEE